MRENKYGTMKSTSRKNYAKAIFISSPLELQNENFLLMLFPSVWERSQK